MADLVLQVQEYLGTIVRVYREKGFKNLVKDFRIREVIMEIELIRAQGEKADWPRTLFHLRH
ncbi:45856_t:CDS:1 [Gigaspora margarita]|uniref:45856_t:CDS:1 n=1 Tax=Gigaspora margarita TaxID=4874 RepID=A0ABN7WLY9_GIGMA|nr:45856_t:CDS:1 [Gigaspora margarita]